LNLIRVMPAKGALLAVTADVVVAGGGVIGTAIAWRAAAAGLDVVVVDPACGEAASLVAAGMLAPVSESLFGEHALLALNLLAVQRFPGFAAELEDVTGHEVGLDPGSAAGIGCRDRQAARCQVTPFAGITRIRFAGLISALAGTPVRQSYPRRRSLRPTWESLRGHDPFVTSPS